MYFQVPMRHVQLTVATIRIGPRPLPLRHGTLQVVERSGGADDGSLDWEIVLHTIEPEPIAHAVHPLAMRVIAGADNEGRLTTADLTGAAMFVRGVEHTVVFRGAGALSGFDPTLLT